MGTSYLLLIWLECVENYCPSGFCFVFAFLVLQRTSILKTLLLKEHYVFSTVILVLNISAPYSTSGMFWTK